MRMLHTDAKGTKVFVLNSNKTQKRNNHPLTNITLLTVHAVK